jgi:hypothetical protein
MAPHQRKKAFNRGTFLLVDGAKYDVSNIVHESTELIPDEIQVLIRRCKWDDELYPTVIDIENECNYETGESMHERDHDRYDAREERDSQESSSSDEDESESSTPYEYVTASSSSNSDDESSSTSSSNVSSGRHLSGDESWNKGHESLATINWTPAPEKIEILKMMEQSGGRAQVPGAVCVGGTELSSTPPRKPPPSLIREESTPGAVHVDGPRTKVKQQSSNSFGKYNDDAPKRDAQDYKQPSDVKLGVASPSVRARERSSFSINSYFSDSDGRGNPSEAALWEHQQQERYQEKDNDENDFWDSGQIKAAAAAFNDCQVSSPPPSKQRMVQITNDLELPLHGAHETTIALETGNVVTVVCLVCRATLRCISKAQYVLCPECRCLTPLNETMDATGGVGLGLLSAFDQSYRVGVS